CRFCSLVQHPKVYRINFSGTDNQTSFQSGRRWSFKCVVPIKLGVLYPRQIWECGSPLLPCNKELGIKPYRGQRAAWGVIVKLRKIRKIAGHSSDINSGHLALRPKWAEPETM